MLYCLQIGGVIAENMPVNTSIGRVSATDPDGANFPAGTVRYSLAPGSGSENFWINDVSGELYTDDRLDYEQK